MRANSFFFTTKWLLAAWFAGFAQAQQPAIPFPSLGSGSASFAQPPMESFPLDGIHCSHPRIAPYLARAVESQTSRLAAPETAQAAIPVDFSPWWEPSALRPIDSSAVFVGVEDLVHSALLHSPNIRALSVEPSIHDSLLVEQSTAFDWRTFLESAYDDFNDPVGNTLTTGDNSNRFLDQKWRANGGVRRTNPLGGQVELGQKLGTQSNNSRFLVPNPQGTARMELNYTHPLLKGSGRFYNRSQIALAQIDSSISRDELSRLLQDHLLQVTGTYWDLYRARTRYVQRVELYHAAEKISHKLSGRESVDSLHRQVLRAKAAVTKRQSEIVRIAAQIDNAEAQLRLLVNDPVLIQTAELTPRVTPLLARIDVSMSDSLTTALAHRPDISKAIRTLDGATVRLGVARNELLPKLDALLSTYVAGLEGGAHPLSAWNNQFTEGRPGFSGGLLWELPKGNRAAIAREQRRRLELQRASSQFENTVETSFTEVEIAVREVATTYREMVGRYQAMLAAADETRFLNDRYELLPGATDSAPLLLEDLLVAQERQADEEAAFVDAQVNYSISLIRLRKAMGTLLQTDSVAVQPDFQASSQPIQNWDALNLPEVPRNAFGK